MFDVGVLAQVLFGGGEVKLDDLAKIRENIRPNYMVVPLKHYQK